MGASITLCFLVAAVPRTQRVSARSTIADVLTEARAMMILVAVRLSEAAPVSWLERCVVIEAREQVAV